MAEATVVCGDAPPTLDYESPVRIVVSTACFLFRPEQMAGCIWALMDPLANYKPRDPTPYAEDTRITKLVGDHHHACKLSKWDPVIVMAKRPPNRPHQKIGNSFELAIRFLAVIGIRDVLVVGSTKRDNKGHKRAEVDAAEHGMLIRYESPVMPPAAAPKEMADASA